MRSESERTKTWPAFYSITDRQIPFINQYTGLEGVNYVYPLAVDLCYLSQPVVNGVGVHQLTINMHG